MCVTRQIAAKGLMLILDSDVSMTAYLPMLTKSFILINHIKCSGGLSFTLHGNSHTIQTHLMQF